MNPVSEPAPSRTDLRALIDVLRTLDFEEYGHMELVGAEWSQEILVLHLDVWRARGGAQPDQWHLRCVRPRAHALTFGRVEHIESRDEHPLLWPYVEPIAELSFHGRPESTATLLGELWQSHVSVAGHRVPFPCRAEVLRGEYGVLADGPACLLRAYEAVLVRHRMKPSLLVLREPKRSEGGARVPEDGGLSVLLLDDSYVVATSIEATRIDVQKAPDARLLAEVLAEGVALGLYDRSDITAWALDIIEQEMKPPIAVIDLAMGSRLDDSETAQLLHAVPGDFTPDAVRDALVGVIAKAVAAHRLDARQAARVLYILCIDAPGDLRELARFDDEFHMAEDGTYGSRDEVAAALEQRLGPLERLAANVPLPARYIADG